MKNIKNENLAGSPLNVGGRVYTGDAGGVFAMENAHADQLLATAGWSAAEAAPIPAAKPDPVAALRETVSSDDIAPPAPGLAPAPTAPPAAEPVEEKAAEVPAEEEHAPTEPPPAEEVPAETEGPDLAQMGSKTKLLAAAKEYGVKLTTAQKKLDINELRALVDREIYGEED